MFFDKYVVNYTTQVSWLWLDRVSIVGEDSGITIRVHAVSQLILEYHRPQEDAISPVTHPQLDPFHQSFQVFHATWQMHVGGFQIQYELDTHHHTPLNNRNNLCCRCTLLLLLACTTPTKLIKRLGTIDPLPFTRREQFHIFTSTLEQTSSGLSVYFWANRA